MNIKQIKLLSLVTLILTGLFSMSTTYAWNYEYTLPPVSAEAYTPVAKGQKMHGINLSYSVYNRVPSMPIRVLHPGQTLRIKMLAPPGMIEASIYAESQQWQGQRSHVGGWVIPESYPLVGAFIYDAQFCLFQGEGHHCNGQAGTFIHPNQLHPVWAGLNEPIYDSRSNPMIKEPKYLYFVIYQQPKAVEPIQLTRLNIGLLIKDVQLYQAWQQTLPADPNKEECLQSFPVPSSIPTPEGWRDWSCCSP